MHDVNTDPLTTVSINSTCAKILGISSAAGQGKSMKPELVLILSWILSHLIRIVYLDDIERASGFETKSHAPRQGWKQLKMTFSHSFSLHEQFQGDKLTFYQLDEGSTFSRSDGGPFITFIAEEVLDAPFVQEYSSLLRSSYQAVHKSNIVSSVLLRLTSDASIEFISSEVRIDLQEHAGAAVLSVAPLSVLTSYMTLLSTWWTIPSSCNCPAQPHHVRDRVYEQLLASAKLAGGSITMDRGNRCHFSCVSASGLRYHHNSIEELVCSLRVHELDKDNQSQTE